SSGVVLRDETKRALLRLNPTMAILDSFGSSEALGVGMATSTAEGVSETATFGLSEKAIVVTDDGRRVAPGSGEVGLVALSGVLRRDGGHLTEDDVVEHVKSRLAGFKAPRRVVFAPRVPRNPAGKVDYAAVRSLVTGAR